MRISLFLLFVCVCQLMAEEAGAQSAEIKISQNSMTIRQLVKEIEAQTEYLVVFRDQDIDVNRTVSFKSKSASVANYLEEVSRSTNIGYRFENNYITLVPKAKVAAQDKKTVTGKIVDANGEPIIGANIVEKGTTNGTITDIDGNFTLEASDKSILIVSFIGYAPREIVVGNQRNISVKLNEDTEVLDEVVVVGYGTQKKSDVTTAVASVSSENLKNRAAVNFGEAMAGQVPGVLIQQTNGAPGGEGLTIKVRGTGSITQSNDPLYVVDGYPMEGGAFRLLNSSDIESIQVLKDASSTAIYGSRGANGVVIITTKKGQIGKPTVQLNAYVGFQQREKKIEMMNRDQYVQWFIDGRNQAWLDAKVISSDPNQSPHSINDPNSRRALYSGASSQYMIPDGTGSYKYNFLDPASVAQMPDNDWQDLLYRNALTQQYELSVNGGSENTRYTFSGSYTNQDGIVRNTDYERFNFRTNVSSKIADCLNVGMSLMAYYANGTEQANGKDSPVMYALNLPPIYPLYNEDGTYGSMVRNPEILAGDVANPIGIADQVMNKRKRHGWLGTIFAEWEIIKNLKYRISINGGIQDNIQKKFEPSYVDFDSSKAPRPAKGINERWTDRDWVIENTLNYSFTLADKHSFNALLGYTTQAHSYEHMKGEARGYANDNITTLNAGTMYALTSDESEYSMISYLGRINYVYDNRYMLTTTLRSDGSSRFGRNKKWGTFPSVSLGWRISQEKFMQDVKPISDLKIRASFGISGNNRIGNYSAIGLLSTGFYPTGDAVQNTVNPNTMPNDDLGWERTRQYNVGFELGLFDNRIRLEGDFYDSRSIDLLLNVPIPTITGYSSQMQNIGKVQNRGMEFTLNTKNFTGRDFTWSSNFNISFNKNKVLEVGVDGRPIYGSAANANNAFITKPGYPIASFYGYKYLGVFQSEEELAKYPHLSGDKVGDGHYEDVNKDGKLDQNDKTILGDNNPLFTAGFSNSFRYKNFTLDVQFTGSYGAEVFSFYKRMCGIYHGDRNGLIEQLGRWQSKEQPGDGIHFRPTRTPSGWQRDPSSAWVQDASYLRLRNLTFGYDFDQKMIEKMKMKGLRLYVTGQNLFTITNYVGYDPETSSESGLSQGGDYLGYPAARSFIIGANITF
ncbi:TonB-dependent receptor [uncultured Parabacteroides sp.]|uniref:TonB-dependent receptor n=1 Tax=uncultured Parabacteroides sp. TaxID=512312 RepID=UPI00262112C5|nr:TonB-dependent receptor [uncultured Parabacteroides sp.]